jgi:hypothetical protein
MRKFTICVAAVVALVAVDMHAQRIKRITSKAPLEVVDMSPAEALKTLQRHGEAERVPGRRNVRPDVSSEEGDVAFIFAIVGSAPGGGGTYFRSETTLVNNLDRPQWIDAYYLPSGAGCAGIVAKSFLLDRFSWHIWSDFVLDFFGRQGLGSVVIFATHSPGGTLDQSADIDGFSRIWTPIPGTSGSASQSFPASTLTSYPYAQWAYGLRQDGNFRTNLGILNYLTDSTRAFNVYINGLQREVTYQVTVPPCTVILQGIPAGTFGPLIIAVDPVDARGGWYGFGSSVDNFSSDNWSSPVRP